MGERKKRYSAGGFKTNGKGIVEDTSEYGEFVATFDAWMTPEELKRRANYIANLNEEN